MLESIEQDKFTYSPLGKAFEKQTKTIEDQGKKQIEAKVKLHKTPSVSDNYFKDRLDEIKKYYKPIDKDDLYICENTYGSLVNFLSYDDPITLFYNIANGHKTLKDAKYQKKKNHLKKG